MIKVLLIDDEEMIRKRLKDLLEMEGYQVLTAENGIIGLDTVEKENPEIVILDIKMPGMDGIEVLGRIKGQLAQAEVIMITGHGGTEHAIAALKKGAFDYITKPISYDELIISINRALEKQQHVQKEIKLIADLKESSEANSQKANALEKALLELKKTQAMLIQAGKMNALGQLAAGVAHELNQPLTTIKGNAQIILEDLKAADSSKEGLETIVSQTQRMIKIIQNLKTFSRMTAFDFKDMSINECIDASLLLFQSQLKNHNIQVDLDMFHNLPFICGDFNQLQQVFTNLIVNARDAMEELPKGDPRILRIKTSVIKDDEGKDDVVEVVFQDSGPGIPQEIRSEIFNPFFTTKGVGKGTGLGLSISHGIIQDHAGTIELMNHQDKGAAFRMTFPVLGTQKSRLAGQP
ncbi:MAG: response regulator [Candidatus Omnitrophica bacterium]|nr:response regulator [Candidatus Omnitrophota bacterium]